MSDKIDRKQLRKPDEFQQVAGRTMEWMVAHQGLVLGAIGAIVVVALGAWGFSTWKERRETKAGTALSEALAVEARPVAGEAAQQPGEDSFPSKEARDQAVLAALEKVRGEHGGTLAAVTATAEIGFHQLKKPDAAAAQKELEAFLGKASGDHPARPFAIESLGYAQEMQGKLEDAKATFAKLADVEFKDRAAFHAARIALVEGKPDAKQQLEQVAKDYAKEPVSMEANQRLEIAALPKYDPSQAPVPAPEKQDKAGAKGKASGKAPKK